MLWQLRSKELTDEAPVAVAQSLEDTEVLDEDTTTGADVNALNLEDNNTPVAQATAVNQGEVKEDGVVVSSATYTGEEVEPKVTVKKKDGTALKEGEDYTVEYFENVNAAKAEDEVHPYVVVSFVEGTAQPITKAFTIKPASITNATVRWENTDAFVYDGTEKYPQVLSVTVDGFENELTTDDYEVKVSQKGGAVQAGSYTAQVVGKGNFTGTATAKKAYNIDQADLGQADVTVTVDEIAYNANLKADTVKKAVHVKDNVNETKKDITNFKIQVMDDKGEWVDCTDANVPKDIGTHSLRVVISDGKGNFLQDSYKEVDFTIVRDASLQTMMKNAKVNGFEDEVVYDGTNHFPATVDKDTLVGVDRSMVYGSDYKIVDEEGEWINAGEYFITVEGLNKYAGQTAKIKAEIDPALLLKEDVKVTQGTHPNSGDAASVVVTVTDTVNKKKVTLEEGKDYTYEVTKEATKKEKGKVEVTGIGNYTTVSGDDKVVEKEYSLSAKLNLNDPSITASMSKDFVYDNASDEIKIQLSDIVLEENDGGSTYTLEDGVDYGFKSGSSYVIVKAGENSVTVTGRGDYTGDRTITFDVEGQSFADTFVLADIDDVAYDAGKKVQDIIDGVKVTYQSTGGTYSKDKYTVEVYDSQGDLMKASDKLTKGGMYTVRVTPKDDDQNVYVGYLETEFAVIGRDLKEAGATIADIADVVYTGEAIEPEVTVTVGKTTLKLSEDYTVSYSDNIKGGEATVTVTGINDYSGTITKNFKITRAAQGIEMTNPLQERDLANGSRNSMSKACTLKLATTMADEDTKFTYTTSDPSVATVNAGKITYQGVGECTITVSAAATDSCEAASLPIKVVVGNPGTPTFTPSVTKNTAEKAFVVTSSTVRGADGFEVQYSIRDDFWRATTKDFANTGSKLLRQTCTTVHSNRTYYVRVRAYQVVDGEKVYSNDWSPVKTVVTK